MAFCKFCGKEIPEGNKCDCAESQSAAVAPAPGAGSAVSEANAQQPSNKAAIVLAAALVIILVIIIALVSSIAGGGYKEPVNQFEKALNKSDGERLAECMFTDDVLEELDDDDYDDLSKTLEWMIELAEEEYGKNVKFSIKIEDKEKIDKKDLEDYEESYNEQYDSDMKFSKGYELEGTIKVKGKDGKDEEDIELTVFKIKGEGWKLSSNMTNLLF